MAKRKYYITSCSGLEPGFFYAAVFSDAMARHRRMTGFDVAHFVAFQAGGGQPDDKSNRTKSQTIARMADIHPTQFGRSGSSWLVGAFETVLRRILRHSWWAIYKSQYEGRYCRDNQIDIREGPKPADCPVCGRAGELLSEERYFFRLSGFRGRLQALYRYRPQLLQPDTRRAEVERFFATGMEDIPISRKSPGFGLPWPDDPGQFASSRFSELVNYLSTLGFGQEGHASDDFRKYWPADLHVVDQTRLLQHAVYWPAFLMAADLPVPRHIFVHGMVSFGRASTDGSPLEKFSQTFGSDALRYCLLREVPYDGEVSLSFDRLAARYDADLADGYRRLARKILAVVARDCGGRIPPPAVMRNFDPTIENATAKARGAVRFLFDHNDFCEGLKIIQRLIALLARALEGRDSTPGSGELGKEGLPPPLIHDVCQALAIVTLMLHPAAPGATEAVWKSLGRKARLEDQLIDETPWSVLRPGSSIGPVGDVFPPVNKPEKSASMVEV
jgi:methionyl-tRNA synthetase